jgi:cell division septum initiation protein DivIVA
MSHFHRHGAKLHEREESEDQPRAPFADVAARFANWVTGIDREHGHAHLPDGDAEAEADEEVDRDPLRMLTAGAVDDDREATRFPVAPLGYNRAAVDEHLADLERELSELGRELAVLRAHRETPMSVTEELERIGEQTASILIVAQDKANETTRRAQEQAERCIADAAANAVAITEEAKRRLGELDNETDSVWRERERLLEDVRAVSAALASLADQASERFPAAADQSATTAFPARAGWGGGRGGTVSFEPQATQAFTPAEEAEARGAGAPESGDLGALGKPAEPAGDPGDTASWLAGFEPPAPDDEA